MFKKQALPIFVLLNGDLLKYYIFRYNIKIELYRKGGYYGRKRNTAQKSRCRRIFKNC